MNWIGTANRLSKSFSKAAAEALFPAECALCGLTSEGWICDLCRSEFKPIERQTAGEWDDIVLGFHYSGRAGQAVRSLKYMRYTALAQPMAAEVAHLFEAHFASLVDAVVPVPIHWTRRVHRGFNQSELLCEDLPKEIVNPTLLARVRRTKPQASLTPEERLNSLAKAFWASPDVRGRHILLVDDVVTSGATLNQCALALKQQGAAKVSALAFAGVP